MTCVDTYLFIDGEDSGLMRRLIRSSVFDGSFARRALGGGVAEPVDAHRHEQGQHGDAGDEIKPGAVGDLRACDRDGPESLEISGVHDPPRVATTASRADSPPMTAHV